MKVWSSVVDFVGCLEAIVSLGRHRAEVVHRHADLIGSDMYVCVCFVCDPGDRDDGC